MDSLFTVDNVFKWGIVFARIGTVFAIMPGFGSTTINARFRLIIALIFSFVVFLFLNNLLPNFSPSLSVFISIILQEIVIGAFLGFITHVLISACTNAGQLAALQSGLGSASLFNPNYAAQEPILGIFFQLSAMALIFSGDIHHLLLQAVIESFFLFKVGNPIETGDLAKVMVTLVTRSFFIGAKLASPYIITSLLISITTAIFARLVPSLQVFFVLAPLQIWISLFLLSIVFCSSLDWFLGEMQNDLLLFFNLEAD